MPSHPLQRGAFDGPSGRNLARILGIPIEELLRRVHPVNVFDEILGQDGNGARLRSEARHRGDELRRMLSEEGRVAVICGTTVARWMRLEDRWFEWKQSGGLRYAVIPHPSGLNRVNNDPVVRQAIRDLVLGAIERYEFEAAERQSADAFNASTERRVPEAMR